MKKSIQILFFSTLFFAISCNEKKNISVKPETTSIKGDLGEYFEVVQKDYVIPIDENSLKQLISVELKRTDKDFSFKTDKLNPYGTNGDEH